MVRHENEAVDVIAAEPLQMLEFAPWAVKRDPEDQTEAAGVHCRFDLRGELGEEGVGHIGQHEPDRIRASILDLPRFGGRFLCWAATDPSPFASHMRSGIDIRGRSGVCPDCTSPRYS